MAQVTKKPETPAKAAAGKVSQVIGAVVDVEFPAGQLPNLPIGNYQLEVSASGFKTYVQQGIVLQVGQNISNNVTMQIGAVSENVEVTAAAAMVEPPM